MSRSSAPVWENPVLSLWDWFVVSVLKVNHVVKNLILCSYCEERGRIQTFEMAQKFMCPHALGHSCQPRVSMLDFFTSCVKPSYSADPLCVQAGDLYEKIRNNQRALECYCKGGAFRKGESATCGCCSYLCQTGSALTCVRS